MIQTPKQVEREQTKDKSNVKSTNKDVFRSMLREIQDVESLTSTIQDITM